MDAAARRLDETAADRHPFIGDAQLSDPINRASGDSFLLNRDNVGLARHSYGAESVGKEDIDREAASRLEVRVLVVLNEEWWHRMYAERDLGILEKRVTA